MSAAQKTAQANFKKAIAYRSKTGCSLKEAFAHVKGNKVTGLDKVVKKGNKTTVLYTKKAKKKAVSKKKVSQGVLFGVKNKPAKKTDMKSTHKDTKSHNVNIRVVSGIGEIGEKFTRINNDVNGNPRYVIHFFDVLNTEERNSLPFTKLYEYAVKKAKKIGGKKYSNKSYGGGIVFQSYNIENTWKKIQELKHTTPKIKI